jgi:hypothetical protein
MRMRMRMRIKDEDEDEDEEEDEDEGSGGLGGAEEVWSESGKGMAEFWQSLGRKRRSGTGSTRVTGRVDRTSVSQLRFSMIFGVICWTKNQ